MTTSQAFIRTWVGAGANALASTPANWSGVAAPITGDAIELNSSHVGNAQTNVTWDLNIQVASWTQTVAYAGTVTFATTFPAGGFPYFEIAGDADLQGGRWTQTPNPSGNIEINRLAVRIGGNLTVAAAAAINVDGRGFAAGMYGPGRGGGEDYGGWGASHGGWDAERLSPGPYGSIVAPTNLGSSCAARAGGGAVWLEVAHTCALNGVISAIGVNVTGSAGYNAGAGGSIFLKTGELAGSGLLNARGGNGYYGGSAGGGRIAILVTNSLSFGNIQALAGGGTNGPGNFVNYEGSAGTVYQEHAGHQPGRGILTIANYHYAYRYTMPNWPVTDMPTGSAPGAPVNLDAFSLIVISNGALGVMSDTAMTNWDLGRLQTYGAESSFIAIRGTNALRLPADLAISNFSLHLDVPVRAAGNWTVASNANLSHSFGSRLDLTLAGNLMVQTGGLVSAHRRGYASGGPGGGAAGYGSGASHAGRGGVGYPDTPTTYGAALSPTTWGSQNNVRGGGAIKLNVTGTLTVHGAIDANGDMTFIGSTYYGSGSGGSVWITAGAFAGTGTVQALGGHGYIGPGGGGRVALVETNGSGLGSLPCSARGGYSTQNKYAGPGTVYRQGASDRPGWGVLAVDNATGLTDTNSWTDLPAPLLGDAPDALKRVVLSVGGGRVNITTNLVLGDLYLTTNAFLFLNGRSIWVRAAYHADWGTSSQVDYRGGRIFWGSAGTVLSVK